MVYLLVLLFPNSYTKIFLEFYFFPFSVHVQTNIIYVTLLIPVQNIITSLIISHIVHSVTSKNT
jgi:hypothetical protein